ncbi:hypothetical protein PMIT1323_02312 [Prochlorococcus marinus str. MIT 1323]|nr:hypothetical protein PMIT1323_02312 [Prochlorococcus marinus str. MIT 1323]
MLRNDTHPPVYYSLLCFWGQIVGQNAVTLRLLSWLAYGLGGIVMVFQAGALAQAIGLSRGRRLCLAALLAFCSSYPVRFAIDGKSCASLVLFVGLAWWRRRRLGIYGSSAGGWATKPHWLCFLLWFGLLTRLLIFFVIARVAGWFSQVSLCLRRPWQGPLVLGPSRKLSRLSC